MVHGVCVCGWAPGPNVRSTGRAIGNHARRCTAWNKIVEGRSNAKRIRSEVDLEDDDGRLSDHPQKTPRLSQVGVKFAL